MLRHCFLQVYQNQPGGVMKLTWSILLTEEPVSYVIFSSQKYLFVIMGSDQQLGLVKHVRFCANGVGVCLHHCGRLIECPQKATLVYDNTGS